MNEKNSSEHQAYLDEIRSIWDKEAESFDNEPDHGLKESHVRLAWKTLLESALPEEKLAILDIGCGTGSLSLLMDELGHEVSAVDLSPDMIERAKSKAKSANRDIRFMVMDAAFPEFEAESFDVILCRHLLWTLPDAPMVLERWAKLLKPKGRFLLIEGFWHTGAGLHAEEILGMLPDSRFDATLKNLSGEADLWGNPVNDERYLIVAELK